MYIVVIEMKDVHGVNYELIYEKNTYQEAHNTAGIAVKSNRAVLRARIFKTGDLIHHDTPIERIERGRRYR